MGERVRWLNDQGRDLEAARLKQRTQFDLEMMREVGYCSGIENYSRHLAGREEGERPWTLIDYFPTDFLLVVDESHITIPQVHGMYKNDRTRKEILVDFGFRLPSALDNRPLRFDEFEDHMSQVVYMSATPGPYETERAEHVAEQFIRPTGVVDPTIAVRPTAGSDRRPAGRDPRDRRARRARPRHDPDEEDGRGPRRLPGRARDQGPVAPLGGRHARAGRDPPRPSPRGLRRPRRHQPAARGPRPARGDARRDPRRGQGRLPAQRRVADPGDRPRGAQHRRPRRHVRRPRDRFDEGGDRRDEPATREADRVQPRARDHAGDGHEGDPRHPRGAAARRRGSASSSSSRARSRRRSRR